MLLSMVLMAFVAKQGDGMRGPTQGKDPPSCEKFGAEGYYYWYGTCQCPKERPVPRKCEGGSDRTFDLKKTIEFGSNCHCEEDPCAEFGAKESRQQPNICQCPTDRPLPRNCVGRSDHTFDLKKTIEEGSNCHCEDPCAQFGAKKKWWRTNTCQCPKEIPFPRNCEGRSGRSFNLNETIEEGSNCHCAHPCEEFGAERYVDDEGWCRCPKDHPRETDECYGSYSYFLLSDAEPGCRCMTEAKALDRLKMPVAASALRFCEALAEDSYRAGGGYMYDTMQDALDAVLWTSPEICQHALVGNITPQEAKQAPFAEEASELSRHGHDEDGDRGYGRMRPVKENATAPGEKKRWEDALAQVCKDECTDLLHMMKEEAKHLEKDVFKNNTPFAQACAEHVVQHVEAEILGCCARSCGYNGRRCLLWPFFSPKEKVEWQLECCAEMSILKNSSRELMCNSVLSGRLAKEASQYDLEEQNGTDVGKVLIGQNSSLVWTRRGIKFQFPKKSKAWRFISKFNPFGKKKKAEATPREGDKVSMEFLQEHKDVGEEYLRLGYFKEEPITKLLNESTSLVEVSSQVGTCDFGKFQHHCPKEWMDTYTKACQESWMVADEEEPGFFMDQVTGRNGGDCSVDKSTNFAAPAECDELAAPANVVVVYFTYDHDNTENPIACVTVGKEQCGTVDEKWLEDLELKPMHEVMNGLEIKNYRDHSIYYVKVKADTKQTNQ